MFKRRTTRRGAMLASLAAGAIGLTRVSRSARAEATPAPCAPTLDARSATEITVQPIAAGAPAATPDHMLNLYRFTLPPGEVVAPHEHPGATILAVEAGELGYTLIRGEAVVHRAGLPGDPITPGAETVLGPGDAVFYDRETAHTARNPGTAPVSVLSVILYPSGEPGTIPTDEDGNPLG